MPPRMTTRSVGRPAAASRGEGTGGRGGCRTRGCSGDQDDGRIDGQGGQVGGQGTQVGDQGRGQGNGRNQNGDAANDNIWGDVSRGCTYKEFLACKPKEYDGKGGAIVYTHWIEIQDMSGCRDSMSWEDFKTLTREEFCLNNESSSLSNPRKIHQKNPKKRGNRGEPSKDRNVRDDNKRTRTENAFATTTNLVGRENTGNFAKDCRVVPRNVNPINARNPTVRAYYECGSTDYVKSVCP
ncbi:hypothetical protein Tco_0937101, partial [Tanacetum coccineum]